MSDENIKNENSILEQGTDLLGNPKELWMVHNAAAFKRWFGKQETWYRIRIQMVTTRNKQGGDLTPEQQKYAAKYRTLPHVKITYEEMYQTWLHMISYEVRRAMRVGDYDQAIAAGQITAHDVRTIIESVQEPVPESILEATQVKLEIEK